MSPAWSVALASWLTAWSSPPPPDMAELNTPETAQAEQSPEPPAAPAPPTVSQDLGPERSEGVGAQPRVLETTNTVLETMQPDLAQIDAALARLPASPSLRELQDAALRRAGTGPSTGATWLRRARVAAALPTVSVQYDHRLDQGWTLDREVGAADALRRDAGTQGVVKAKATWELDRVVFSPDELRAVRALLDLADFRERVLVEVTQLYYERQRLLLERELAPPTDLDAAIAAAIRLREIEGVLTGLTGLEL